MSDLSSDVTWREILRETESGDIPHCRAIAAPQELHNEIVESLARIILGSYRPSHPDLLITGTTDKAPDVDTCRSLINNIALKPMESRRRFGVVMSADKLFIYAANSLLKLAEEPPAHAALLFLMQDGRLFLPTLKSRSRYSVITTERQHEAHRMPQDAQEWAEWLADTRKSADVEGVVKELEAWSNFALSEKNIILAEKIEGVRLIAAKKNLSIPLLCDMIILILREGNIYCEHILDDIREA